jgi:hypothetical protein
MRKMRDPFVRVHTISDADECGQIDVWHIGRWTYRRKCHRPAAWHIIWNPQGENGLACTKHMPGIERHNVYVTRHPKAIQCLRRGTITVIPSAPADWSYCAEDDIECNVREA